MIERFSIANPSTLPNARLTDIGTLRQRDLSRAISKAAPRLKGFLEGIAGGSELAFDPSINQYRNNGTPASSIYLQEFVALARDGLSRRLENVTERLLSGRATLAEWERVVAEELKDHHLMMLLFAFGGVALLTQHPSRGGLFSQSGENIRAELVGLAIFAAAVANGLRTPGQIRGYAKYKANSVRGAFERARHLALTSIGYNEAWRSLDPTARHCPDCPGYETQGWAAIGDVVPVGHACACNGRCRCRVEYRFNPQRALQEIGGADLLSVIQAQNDMRANRF